MVTVQSLQAANSALVKQVHALKDLLAQREKDYEQLYQHWAQADNECIALREKLEAKTFLSATIEA